MGTRVTVVHLEAPWSFSISIKNGSLFLQAQGVGVLMNPEAGRSPSFVTDPIKAVLD
jgi:hypothetical protein